MPAFVNRKRFSWLGVLSPAAWVIVLLAAGSSLAVLALPSRETKGSDLWTFSRNGARTYQPLVARWNEEHLPNVAVSVFSSQALERRMMSGFLSRTPLADMIEVDVNAVARAFLGPLESVGFVDLTERMREEGILERVIPASLSPWMSRGRVFGLPRAVHPVLMCYRADLVEAAGIDVSRIETWDDFITVMRPLMADGDGDGSPDRYLLGFWLTQFDLLETLILQAGGRCFDESGEPVLDSAINAHVVATAVSWCVGPGRITADLPEASASGYKLRLDGYAVAFLMPDWLCYRWKLDIPGLAGKVKLMPLPAWSKGGRRTSVLGGTMLGITRQAQDFEATWQFAKHLYLSREIAQILYRETDSISPVKTFWDDPVYDEPDPYFCGQAKGRLYIEQAPFVPRRVASPYSGFAKARLGDVMIALAEYAQSRRHYSAAELEPEARRLLGKAQAALQRQMGKNTFLPPSQP